LQNKRDLQFLIDLLEFLLNRLFTNFHIVIN